MNCPYCKFDLNINRLRHSDVLICCSDITTHRLYINKVGFFLKIILPDKNNEKVFQSASFFSNDSVMIKDMSLLENKTLEELIELHNKLSVFS